MRAYTIEQISNIAASKSVKLLSTVYKSRKLNLVFECSIHGKFSTSLASLIQSHGCPKCGSLIGSAKQKAKIEDVKKLFLECSYIPLFNTYKNAKEKLSYLCPKHGESKITYDNLKQGKRCKKCSFENLSNSNRLKEEDYNKLIEELTKKKIKPLFKYNQYLGLKESAKFQCEIHGEFESNLDRLKYGNGCRKCTTHHSDAQYEISQFIASLGIQIIENDRKFIKPLEIDILCPDQLVGIEYCGLWWHNELYKNKKEHKNKLNKANDKGLNLITIFEDEWLEKQDQIKGYLKSLLNLNSIILYGRNTEIKEVPKDQTKTFLDKYHIQGDCNFKIAFGLYYNEELVGVVTGGKHHRNSSRNELILNRIVFKSDITIVGGASKLLNQLKKYAKDNNYTKIISWSDNRWSKGNVYKKIGFAKTHDFPPNYSYIKKDNRFSKQSLTKTRLRKLGGVGNTEREMALSLGYRRIWDCGKIKWELDLITN